MIVRPEPLGRIKTALRRQRVVAFIGPRQAGKTTLARQVQDVRSRNDFDLEDPTTLARLDEPMTALRSLRGLVVIDEVQRRPDLFPVLRVERADAPTVTRSMRIALEDLQLTHLAVLYPGETPYELDGRISVVPLSALGQEGAARLSGPPARSRKQ